jgi:hypothetical protein
MHLALSDDDARTLRDLLTDFFRSCASRSHAPKQRCSVTPWSCGRKSSSGCSWIWNGSWPSGTSGLSWRCGIFTSACFADCRFAPTRCA